MNREELKQKCEERAKIFQQAMESCHSSNPMDCIEWFADRIADLEEKLANADYQLEGRDNEIDELKEQNTNLQIMLKAEREVRCNEDYLKRVTDLEEQIEKMKCCENCAFFKDKTYDICNRIKKLGTRKCAFYKMI